MLTQDIVGYRGGAVRQVMMYHMLKDPVFDKRRTLSVFTAIPAGAILDCSKAAIDYILQKFQGTTADQCVASRPRSLAPSRPRALAPSRPRALAPSLPLQLPSTPTSALHLLRRGSV